MRSTLARGALRLGLAWLVLFTLASSVRAADLGITADFDGDGRSDRALLDRHEPSVVLVWLSKSGRTTVVRARTAVSAIAATDLDGDRRAELVTSDATTRLQVWTKSRGGFRSVRAREGGANLHHVPRHRVADDPAPNDDPNVTAHTIHALTLARCARPRAPDAGIPSATPPDPTASDPGAAIGPAAPRPPPATSLL